MAAESPSTADTESALRFVVDVERHAERTLLSDELRSQLQARTARVWQHTVSGRTTGWAVGAEQGGGWTVEVVALQPAGTERLLTDVVSAARATPAQWVRWWTHIDDPSLDGIAGTLGFSVDRRLLQLRAALPLPRAESPASGVPTRAFRPGEDDAAWLVTNNAAFSWHGEQGGWTIAQFQRRRAEPWFDPEGLLVVDGPLTADGGLPGFCWTKLHTDVTPVIGEIYVIAVHPAMAGRGLGTSLTRAGLDHLHEAGAGDAMLYVDETNVPAVKMYRGLGFSTHHTDVSYLLRLEP